MRLIWNCIGHRVRFGDGGDEGEVGEEKDGGEGFDDKHFFGLGRIGLCEELFVVRINDG